MEKVEKRKRPPEAPQPPEIERRVSFYPTQAIGMPLIMLLPAIALLGLFQSSSAHASAKGGGLSLDVTYPGRLRFRSSEPLRISVRNESGSAVAEMRVKLSSRYMDAFDHPEFDPSPEEIEEEFIVFEFKDVEPDGVRSVEIEMEADQPGSQKGTVRAETDSGSSAETDFSTFVFP